MSAAPRTKPVASKGKSRASAPSTLSLMAGDALQTWAIPGVTVAVVLVAAALSALELVGTNFALAVAVMATLVLLVYVGERPLLDSDVSPRDRAVGAGLALVWLIACYVPFHTRIFPGTPLVDGTELSATGTGLPLTIPAAGHRAIDLVLSGQLTANPSGGTALPVQYSITVEGQDVTNPVNHDHPN